MDWKIIVSEVLEYNNLNQVELSKKSGVSAPHICALKRGTRTMPSFDVGLSILRFHPNKKEYLK